MANPSTEPGLDACIRQLLNRPEGKRYRSDDDIRIQLLHDLKSHASQRDRVLSSGELGKDERSFEEGWRDGLISMKECISEAKPVLSRTTGLFRPHPLTTDNYSRQLVALVHAAAAYAEDLLGKPQQNVIRGSYRMNPPKDRLRPGTYYVNAMYEGQQSVWATVVFHEDGGFSRGSRWDSPKQFLRYVEAEPRLINFMKTRYVHDSHEYQYRQGWSSATAEMNFIAAKYRRGLPLYSSE